MKARHGLPPQDLGAGPLSAVDPHIALDVSLAGDGVSLGNTADQTSNRTNTGSFVTQISVVASAWPREEGEGSFCQLHHRRKRS